MKDRKLFFLCVLMSFVLKASASVLSVRNLPRITHARHRLLRLGARPLGSVEQNFLQLIGLRQDGGATLADRIEARVERSGEFRLHLDVAHLAGAVARLEILDFLCVRVERVVIREYRISFDRAWDV